MKAKLLIETVVAGETISKEKLTSSEIKNYISRKTEAIQNQFKELNITLIDDEKDVERYTSKKSKTATPKKSTVQETYELWVEKKSIDEIATIRVLTKQTIYSHFVKLIQTKAVARPCEVHHLQSLMQISSETAKSSRQTLRSSASSPSLFSPQA